MAGHSRWAQIKHKKAITDQKKGQVFSKISREITIAAQDNPDLKNNYRLKAVVDKARSLNMPQDNIERAIKKVSEKNSGKLTELQLDAVGPGNVAMIITAITDNRNRTISELRTLFTKLDVRMRQEGSHSWMFKRMGILRFSHPAHPEELELKAIEAGAEDVREHNGDIAIYTRSDDLERIQKELRPLVSADESGLELVPSSLVTLSSDDFKKLDQILEALDNNDDVQNIFTNSA